MYVVFAFILQSILTTVMLLFLMPFASQVISKWFLANRKDEMQQEKKTVFGTVGLKDKATKYKKTQDKTVFVSYTLRSVVYSGAWIIGVFFVINKQQWEKHIAQSFAAYS